MTSPDRSAALNGLANFPLLDALFGRRSRRFGVGMSIPDGPLAHTSRLPPQPLSEIERAISIAVGVGSGGWNLGSPAFVRYIGTLAQDVDDTYGKFPGSQPSIGVAAYT